MPSAAPSRPNILVICSDQHHPGMSGYRGHPLVQTPHLDALAADGAAFTRAYCTSPVCTPSRMSFITGKFVHQIGNWAIGVPLDPRENTWARRLHQAGIESTMLGKMDFCGKYQDGGFTHHQIILKRGAWDPYPRQSPLAGRLEGAGRPDKYKWVRTAHTREEGLAELLASGRIQSTEGLAPFDCEEQTGLYDHDRQITDWGLEYLRDKAANSGGKPWALYLGYLQPHWPFVCPRKYFQMYYPDRVQLPFDFRFPNDSLHPAVQNFQRAIRVGDLSQQDQRKVLAAYYGMITCLDDLIGQIVAELKRTGQYDNTCIIYTSDHGESAGEHGLFYKQCAYEGSVGVPLIVKAPGIRAGCQCDHPVDLVDMYPTILDMAGLEVEPDRPGQSWLQLLHGRPTRRDWAFSEFHGNLFRNDWYMLVRGDFKFIHYVNMRPSLFNRRSDPRELHDLAEDPAHAHVLAEFDALLKSILDPQATALRAKRDLGLIGPGGQDYTQTLTVTQLREGIEAGRFPPPSRETLEK